MYTLGIMSNISHDPNEGLKQIVSLAQHDVRGLQGDRWRRKITGSVGQERTPLTNKTFNLPFLRLVYICFTFINAQFLIGDSRYSFSVK